MGNRLLKFLLMSLFVGFVSSLGFSQCNYSVKLYNQNGTGWDADRLTVLVNGSPVLSNIYLASGSGPSSAYSFSVSDGDAISFSYADNTYPGVPVDINPGNYFRVFDSQNNIVATYGLAPGDATLSIANGGTLLRGPVAASCPVTDLAITSVEQADPNNPGNVTINFQNNGTVPVASFNISLVVNGGVPTVVAYAGLPIAPSGTGNMVVSGVVLPLNFNTVVASHDLSDDFSGNDSANGVLVNKITDLEVLSISSTPGDAASDVVILIQNNGPVTLNGASDAFPIGYSVNNGSPVTFTYVPSSFDPSDIVSYTFSVPADLSAGGSYIVLGYATFYGDMELGNNQATQSFEVGGDLATSWATIGGGCGLTVPRLLITNVGSNSFTVPAGTIAYYTINGGVPVNYNLAAPMVLAPQASWEVVFAAANFTGALSYAAGLDASFSDNNNANNSISGVFNGAVSALPAITPSSPFLYPSFALPATQYFSYVSNNDANLSIIGDNLVLGGDDSPVVGWTGGFQVNGTSQFDVWNTNASHISSAILCEVNTATFSPNAELLMDISQEFVVGPGYTHFRVLLNGSPLTDVNTGLSVFSPSDYVTPSPWQTLRFNLPNTSSFVITLQASNNFEGNLTNVKNIKIRRKPSTDVGVAAILSPVSGCSLSGAPSVVVKIKNYGSSNVSGVTVSANINGLGVVSSVYAPILPPNGTVNVTLTPSYTVSYPATIVATATVTGDADADNNSLSSIVENFTASVPYTNDFLANPFSDGWSYVDMNGSEHWDWGMYSGDWSVAINFQNLGANDWLFSNCIQVNSITDTLLVDFWYSTLNGNSSKNFSFGYGSAPNSMSMTSLGSFTNVNTTGSYAGYVLTGLTPGLYYFGWNAVGPLTSDVQYLIIDDFEVTPFGKTDLEVTDVVLNANACVGLNNEPVQITVTNNGPVALEMGTVIPVSYTVNGGGLVSENLVLGADLTVGGSVNYTFTSTIDMTAAGEYDVLADVNFAWEKTPANDDLEATRVTFGYPANLAIDQESVAHCYSLGGSISLSGSYTSQTYALPYTEGFSGPEVAGNMLSFNVQAAGESVGYAVSYSVTNGGGCNSVYNGTILVGNPAVNLGADIETNDYSLVTLDAGAGTGPLAYSYQWSNGGNTQTIVPPYYGQYSVTVTQGPAGCQVVDDIWIYQVHQISLVGGWGIFSCLINTDIAPDVFNSIDEYFVDNGIDGDVIIVKNAIGAVYWPAFAINLIGDLVVGESYQYKMAVPAVLEITGTPVDPAVTPVNLILGYSFIGYLRQAPMPIVTALADVSGNPGFLVKDELGKLYWPTYYINTIGNMLPGKGYKVRSLIPDVFFYPANTVNVPGNEMKEGDFSSNHFGTRKPGGSSMVIGIPLESWVSAPSYGDEIGIFDSNGQLGGVAVYNGENLGLSVWGDDETTSQKDGFASGEEMVIKVWSRLTGSETIYQVVNWTEGNGTFSPEGVSVVGSLKAVSSSVDLLELLPVSPNPASELSEVTFNLPYDSNVEMDIVSSTGQVVQSLLNENIPAGNHVVKVSLSSMASGLYFVKLQVGNEVVVRPLSVQR